MPRSSFAPTKVHVMANLHRQLVTIKYERRKHSFPCLAIVWPLERQFGRRGVLDVKVSCCIAWPSIWIAVGCDLEAVVRSDAHQYGHTEVRHKAIEHVLDLAAFLPLVSFGKHDEIHLFLLAKHTQTADPAVSLIIPRVTIIRNCKRHSQRRHGSALTKTFRRPRVGRYRSSVAQMSSLMMALGATEIPR